MWHRSALSLFIHIAAISIFISFPKNDDSGRNPWLEVRLVSLGTGEIGDGVGQGGGSGGSPEYLADEFSGTGR